MAGAVASLLGSAALAADAPAGGAAKACYRTHCGKSVTGYEGQCGGTRVDGITDQKTCESAGGAWTTEADAVKFKKS
jgi:hypothetical protein